MFFPLKKQIIGFRFIHYFLLKKKGSYVICPVYFMKTFSIYHFLKTEVIFFEGKTKEELL